MPLTQVRRPTVNGPDEPAEANLRYEVLNALKGVVGRGAVIKQQENSGEDLDDEQEQGHTPEVVPDRMAMDGNNLVAQELLNSSRAEPFVQPGKSLSS
jgi:hypothetical protein